MRFTSKFKLLLAASFLLPLILSAQTKVNPVTGINWPAITGAGTPSATGAVCDATHYGQAYQDLSVSPNLVYTCGSDGWAVRGGTGGTGCVGGNLISNGCTGATTAAAAAAALVNQNPVLPSALGNSYHTSGFPSTCTVNSVGYTTAGDCAFYTALYVAQTSGKNQVLIVDQGETDTCAGWQHPVLSNNRTVSLVGAAAYPGSWDIYANIGTPVVWLKQTCNIGTTAVITYASGAGISGSNGPVATVKGIYIDANSNAGACLDGLRLTRGEIGNDVCVGVTGTHRHGFQFGDSTHAFTTGWDYETAIHDLTVYTNTQVNLSGMGGGTVTIASGSASGYAITAAGGVGSFTAPTTSYSVIFTGWGVGVSQPTGPQPCATNPTAHVTTITSGQLAGIAFDTTGSGCDSAHTYFEVVPKPVMDEAFLFDNYTDGVATNLVSVGAVNTAAAYVGANSSDFKLGSFHPYGGNAVGLLLDGSSVDVDAMNCDTPLQACVVNRSYGSWIHGGDRLHVAYQPGAGDFWDVTPNNAMWGPLSGCTTLSFPLVGYNLYGSTTGPINLSKTGFTSSGSRLSMSLVLGCSVASFGDGDTFSSLAAPAVIAGELHFVTNIAGPGQAECVATAGAADEGAFPGYNSATGIVTFPADVYGNGGYLRCVDNTGNVIERNIATTGTSSQTFDIGTILTAGITGNSINWYSSHNFYGGTNFYSSTANLQAVGPNTTTPGIMSLHTVSSNSSVDNYGIYLNPAGSVYLGKATTFFDAGGAYNDTGSTLAGGLIPGSFIMDGNNGAGYRLQSMGLSTNTVLPMSFNSFSSNYSLIYNMITMSNTGLVHVGNTATTDQAGNLTVNSCVGCLTGGSGSTTLTQTSLDDSLTTWKPVCVVGGCAGGTPGGTDTPTATVQTIGNASPSLDGASMLLSLTTPVTSTQTNALWARNGASCDTCTSLTSDFEVYIGSNGAHASSFEFDSYEFDKTDLLNFMFGTQCNQTAGFWQIANQSSGWTSTTLACSLSYSAWHHIIENFTRDAASSTACSGMPCEHFVSISIDGTVTTLGLTEPSTVLPGTYASVIANQFQIDVGATTSAQTVTMNLDEVNFSASPTTAGQFLPLMGGTLTGALYGPSFNDLNLTGYGSTSNINLGGALNPAATGTNNIAAGAGSMNALTTGYNNHTFGDGTLYYCTTCYSNNAFGLNALQFLTTGYENNALGTGALNATTTGHANDAQGHNALGQNIDGSSNVGIGAYAGWNSGTPLQHTNTSTFIGEGSNNSVDGLANTTVIGYGAQGTASNQVTIGNAEVTNTILQGAVAAGTSVKTGVYTVSALPTGLPAGSIVAVSDASSLTAGACVGLGSTYTVAIYNGTTWTCM